jgi:mannose-1-phosphate guanylyltransferase
LDAEEPDLIFIFSPKISAKISDKNHNVTEQEVREAFFNSDGNSLIDPRDQHKTNPATLWFVSETNKGRKLKVCYVFDGDHTIYVKTAYDATENIIRIFEKYSN